MQYEKLVKSYAWFLKAYHFNFQCTFQRHQAPAGHCTAIYQLFPELSSPHPKKTPYLLSRHRPFLLSSCQLLSRLYPLQLCTSWLFRINRAVGCLFPLCPFCCVWVIFVRTIFAKSTYEVVCVSTSFVIRLN